MVSEALKKVFYAGIGAAAVAVEKTGDVLDKLEEKGQQAVQEGKATSGELRQKMSAVGSSVKDVLDTLEKMSREQIQQIREKLADMGDVVDVTVEDVKTDAEKVLSTLETLSRDEIEAVKAKIDDMAQKWSERSDDNEEQ